MTTAMLVSMLVRGAALMALAGVAAVALRRAAPAHRHLAWTLGAVALLALPVLRLALPEFDVPLFAPDVRAPEREVTVNVPAAPVVTIPRFDPVADPDATEVQSVHARATAAPAPRIEVASWALGFGSPVRR